MTVPLKTKIIRKIPHSDRPTESFCHTVGFGFTGRQKDRYLRCAAAVPGVLSEMYRCAACASSGQWATCPICIRPHQEIPRKSLTSKAPRQGFCLQKVPCKSFQHALVSHSWSRHASCRFFRSELNVWTVQGKKTQSHYSAAEDSCFALLQFSLGVRSDFDFLKRTRH